MKQRPQCGLSMIIWVIMIAVPAGYSQSSANYSLKKSTLDQAGSVSSSENFQIHDAAGQSSPTGLSVSANYREQSGFFNGIESVTGIQENPDEMLPAVFRLHQNYPNPFNPVTTIRYQLPKNETVIILLYDALGRLVDRLMNQNQESGSHIVHWDGSNQPSGLYFLVIRAGDHSERIKMILLK